LGVGIVGSVAATMEAEIVSDTSQDPRYVVDDEFRYSEITVPIVYEGRLLGVIDSEHPDKNFYTREQLEILKIIASMSATKIQQAMVFDHLQIQTEKLKISNNRLLQFAYIASHDLRSPVSNIVTLLSFFDEKKIDSENLLFFNNIKKASKKLQDNLHHLIEMVMDENNLYKRGEAINLCKLLDEVRFGIEKQLEESGAAIEVQFQVQSVIYPSVYLHSIIQNLITNAIKYRSPDRPPVIKVKTRKQGKFTCLSVEDNGRGIDLQKNRFKIFSRLERFDRDVEGKGIGLYLIKTQVEALGGKIEVESELGVGTKFHVYLSPEWKE
jgi:signal transduction histidine kinase